MSDAPPTPISLIPEEELSFTITEWMYLVCRPLVERDLLQLVSDCSHLVLPSSFLNKLQNSNLVSNLFFNDRRIVVREECIWSVQQQFAVFMKIVNLVNYHKYRPVFHVHTYTNFQLREEKNICKQVLINRYEFAVETQPYCMCVQKCWTVYCWEHGAVEF